MGFVWLLVVFHTCVCLSFLSSIGLFWGGAGVTNHSFSTGFLSCCGKCFIETKPIIGLLSPGQQNPTLPFSETRRFVSKPTTDFSRSLWLVGSNEWPVCQNNVCCEHNAVRTCGLIDLLSTARWGEPAHLRGCHTACVWTVALREGQSNLVKKIWWRRTVFQMVASRLSKATSILKNFEFDRSFDMVCFTPPPPCVKQQHGVEVNRLLCEVPLGRSTMW